MSDEPAYILSRTACGFYFRDAALNDAVTGAIRVESRKQQCRSSFCICTDESVGLSPRCRRLSSAGYTRPPFCSPNMAMLLERCAKWKPLPPRRMDALGRDLREKLGTPVGVAP